MAGGFGRTKNRALSIIKVMQDSIFTKIIKGEIPCHKIYEDEKTFAFLDIHPSSAGHTLVVPKKQIEFVWDLEDEDYEAVMRTVKKLSEHIKEKLGVKYVGLKVIGTDVPHAHVHIIPFDDVRGEYYNIARADDEPNHESLAKIAEKLRLS